MWSASVSSSVRRRLAASVRLVRLRGVGPGTYKPSFPKGKSCTMGIGARPEAEDAGDTPGPTEPAFRPLGMEEEARGTMWCNGWPAIQW